MHPNRIPIAKQSHGGGVMVPRWKVIENIQCLQNELDLVDIWRSKNPPTKSFTWSQSSPQVFCRLDYWLMSNNLPDFVESTDNTPIKTDHAAIELDLKVHIKVLKVLATALYLFSSKMNITSMNWKMIFQNILQNGKQQALETCQISAPFGIGRNI